MRRHRSDATSVSDPIASATVVGLPSFNFIEPRKPQESRKKACVRSPQISAVPPLSPQLPALPSGRRTPRHDQHYQEQEAAPMSATVNVDAMLDAAIRTRTAQMQDTTM
jgi:hypothetical protein